MKSLSQDSSSLEFWDKVVHGEDAKNKNTYWVKHQETYNMIFFVTPSFLKGSSGGIPGAMACWPQLATRSKDDQGETRSP